MSIFQVVLFLNLSFIFCLSVSISNHLKYMESIRIGLQPSSIKLCVIIRLNQLQLLFYTILFFINSTLVKVYTFLFILVMNWLCQIFSAKKFQYFGFSRHCRANEEQKIDGSFHPALCLTFTFPIFSNFLKYFQIFSNIFTLLFCLTFTISRDEVDQIFSNTGMDQVTVFQSLSAFLYMKNVFCIFFSFSGWTAFL